MRFNPPLEEAILIKRYKRFLTDVTLADGSILTMHCPNTGSMKNCGEPGSRIWYSTSDNPNRKYANTFEIVETADGKLAGINTARANALVKEALDSEMLETLSGYGVIQSEVRYGQESSRVDFLLSEHPDDDRPCYVEVKSVTLGMGQGQGLFPDAVTSRGSKHLRELTVLVEEGKRAVLLFCVQHTGIEKVSVAAEIDPIYAQTLQEAIRAGVEVMAWRAKISPEELVLEKEIPFQINPEQEKADRALPGPVLS